MTARVLVGDCREVLAELPPNSIDACVTDPPYGLEFMGKDWDRLDWRDGGGMSKPGIGERQTAWPSFGGETANPTCATCGGRARGAKKCACDEPDWRVRGEPMDRSGQAKQRAQSMQAWHETWARAVYRVLKPGAHLLAFGGTRTHHRMMVAIEDAGFEIRDGLLWLYAQGFPKSLDVERAIAVATCRLPGRHFGRTLPSEEKRLPDDHICPVTPESEPWAGYGTALKPAYEPIVLARKPLIGSVAANVTAYGTGGINVDGCRIGTDGGTAKGNPPKEKSNGIYGDGVNGACEILDIGKGRWPANVILDDESAKLLDAMSGEHAGSGQRKVSSGEGFSTVKYAGAIGHGEKTINTGVRDFGDTGGASRFFYTAKASRAERNKGLGGMPEVAVSIGDVRPNGGMHERYGESNGSGRSAVSANHHPTVKPVDLMQWLVRLITPKGGTVLDPFLGSGSTGIAADREGFDFIGIEQDADYAEIARKRIVGDCPLFTTLAAD